jgi:hypothetical protein
VTCRGGAEAAEVDWRDLCLCLFEAPGPEVVRVNDIAQFPLARVLAVLSSASGTTPTVDLEEDKDQ